MKKPKLIKKIIGYSMLTATSITLMSSATSCFALLNSFKTDKQKKQNEATTSKSDLINQRIETKKDDEKNASANNQQSDNKVPNTNVSLSNNPYRQLTKQAGYWRIGHWNVLNQGGDNELKNLLLARTINYLNLDVIALTEINAHNENDQAVKNIIKYLNQWNKENPYAYVLSDELYSPDFVTQKERVAFIYRANVFDVQQEFYFLKNKRTNEPIELKQVVTTEENDPNIKITYSRTPYGVSFIDKQKQMDFSILAVHLDSPGSSKNAKSKQDFDYHYNNGTKELNEAYWLKKVMQMFDEQDGNNQDLILTGDTNIKGKNHNLVFGHFKNQPNVYTSLLDPMMKTSLGQTYSKYVSAYDKLFLHTDRDLKQAYTNQQMLDLWNMGQSRYDIIDDEIRRIVLENWIEKGKNSKKKPANYSEDEIKMWIQNWKYFDDLTKRSTLTKPVRDQIVAYINYLVRNQTSDHAPVFFDLKIDTQDIANETPKN
ncbi:endonuclease/exonuclease/phosphatase family protein [Ureaplasma sp. ES3154-GEN]|uniref:endonuclease/exonuclease/phosphatase family protein n=1 Tax=Ureaplasma sp. ES3154-GEN TaxID=2984844 RepID=UPI0021E89083|nr:endonuclease/exonuclease/phosphatase family protein [Ureaplasma sp. ES3154-GEN]MCV3743302.1 endonuclease/exonuclease/phosphatase family protein [Ureaplasma sp. ES3154-GEN]